MPLGLESWQIYVLAYIQAPSLIVAIVLYFIMGSMSLMGWFFDNEVSTWVAAILAKIGTLLITIGIAFEIIWRQQSLHEFVMIDFSVLTHFMLFLMYLAYFIVDGAVLRHEISKKGLAVIAIIGMCNIPLVYFSAEWWQAYHHKPKLINFYMHVFPEEIWFSIGLSFCWLMFFTFWFTSNQVLQRLK